MCLKPLHTWPVFKTTINAPARRRTLLLGAKLQTIPEIWSRVKMRNLSSFALVGAATRTASSYHLVYQAHNYYANAD